LIFFISLSPDRAGFNKLGGAGRSQAPVAGVIDGTEKESKWRKE